MSIADIAPIICRPATLLDLHFIYQCIRESAIESGHLLQFPHTMTTIENSLFSPHAFAEAIIAEINKESAGVLLFSVTHLNFTVFTAPGIFVHDVCVLKKFRRKGIAKELGNYLKHVAKERKCNRIDGIILKDNENALAFYQSIDDLKVLNYIHYMRLNL